MYLLIRNINEPRADELKASIDPKELAIEILCKSKLDYTYLRSRISLLFKFIYRMTLDDIKKENEIIYLTRENIDYVIYKKDIFTIKNRYSFYEKSMKMLYNDPESFVPVKLITI